MDAGELLSASSPTSVPDSFFVVHLAVHLEDLPPGRPRVRDRHLKIHEDRDNLPGLPVKP
jgi:hypothetical protein